MSIVLAVAEAGSLSAAARQQRTPLATVSRKVSELEALLQTKLLNRSSRTLIPTDAGRSNIATSKRILANVPEVERGRLRRVYGSARGPECVNTRCTRPRASTARCRGVLATFREVDVQLGLHVRAVNLLEEHVDVAPRLGALADSSLIAVRVAKFVAYSARVQLI